MDVGRYLVKAHLREGRPVGELARLHGVHRSWLYKRVARYRAEGEAGLAPRSRRPHRMPGAMAPEVPSGDHPAAHRGNWFSIKNP